jgi:hypothetical protein
VGGGVAVRRRRRLSRERRVELSTSEG